LTINKKLEELSGRVCHLLAENKELQKVNDDDDDLIQTLSNMIKSLKNVIIHQKTKIAHLESKVFMLDKIVKTEETITVTQKTIITQQIEKIKELEKEIGGKNV